MASVRVKRRAKQVSYFVDYRMNGSRVRKSFTTKGEAKEFKRTLDCGQVTLQKPNTLLGAAVQTYFTLRSKRKCAETQKNEKKWFEALYNYLVNVSRVEYVEEVRPSHLELYQQHLVDGGRLSNSTINRRFTTFRNFFNFCVTQDWIARSPMRAVPQLRATYKKKRLPSAEEIQQVLGAVTPLVKDLLLVHWITGARPVELRELRSEDIDFERGIMMLHSRKGSGDLRTRMVPMTEDLSAILGRRVSGGLFRSVGRCTVSQAVRRACDRLGIKRFCPYALRHLFCTENADMGSNIFAVQQLMGHASIRTTQGYYQGRAEELAKVMQSRKIVGTPGHQGESERDYNQG